MAVSKNEINKINEIATQNYRQEEAVAMTVFTIDENIWIWDLFLKKSLLNIEFLLF